MKVLLVNGSSRKNGCTNTALREVERALNEEGVETEVFFIGNEPLPDCIACRKCREIGRCIFDDIVNEFVEKAKSADGCAFRKAGRYDCFYGCNQQVFYNQFHAYYFLYLLESGLWCTAGTGLRG